VIIALAALRAGLHDVVKASIAGSIVGDILLVLGAAMLASGIRHEEQHFNAAGARSQATMLTLAAIALIVPAAYRALVAEHVPGGQGPSASRYRWSCSRCTVCFSYFHYGRIPRCSLGSLYPRSGICWEIRAGRLPYAQQPDPVEAHLGQTIQFHIGNVVQCGWPTEPTRQLCQPNACIDLVKREIKPAHITRLR
jgi:sodium/calcium exchanger protein